MQAGTCHGRHGPGPADGPDGAPCYDSRVKRRRSSAPGGSRPDGRWCQPTLLAAFVVALAACGSSTGTDRSAATAASIPTNGQSVAPATRTPGGDPSATSETPTPTPGPPGATATTPTRSPAPDPGGTQACSGSDANRDFYASMAAAVDWIVYCPVLPDGWFVKDGQYRLAAGGWLEITYDGPGDDGITLRQGAFCAEADGCVPAGREVGTSAFGDRIGALIAGDDGTWAVVVDRGANPSWLLEVSGLDEATARSVAEQLLTVGG